MPQSTNSNLLFPNSNLKYDQRTLKYRVHFYDLSKVKMNGFTMEIDIKLT